MVDQTIAKPIGLIHGLWILVHGIPYNVTFTIMKNNVLDYTYSICLGWPWLHDVKVSHDWGTNIIIIHGNGMVKTITLTKHLRSQTKCFEVFLCSDFQNGITYEEEDLVFKTKFGFFLIILLIYQLFNNSNF